MLASVARTIYVDGPAVHRGMMALRPYICPFDRLIELIPVGASVLDVGCGCGLFLGLLAATGRTTRGFGFDVSEAAIPTARRMARRLSESDIPTDLRFERIGVDDPWPSGSFDVVSLVDVMHHVPPARQRGLFAAATGSVRAGGLLLYKDVGPKPLWRAWANRLHDLVLAREWVHLIPAAQVEGWGREEGLELLHSERINRLWYGHDLLAFRRPG
jgi:2-polyprenyl-3-methyl-5-hydroxy-6-metoxy-1,4-benzoquinol methylase